MEERSKTNKEIYEQKYTVKELSQKPFIVGVVMAHYTMRY